MKNIFEDFGERLFNASVNLGHKMLDRGYVKAWFNWIEWISLTSLIFVVAKRTNSWFLYGVVALSAFILFFVGLAAVEKLGDELVPLSARNGKIVKLFIAALINVVGMWVVMSVLFELLPASVT